MKQGCQRRRSLLFLPGQVVVLLWQRPVHLVDEARRHELMVIYLEDLSPLKLSAADLSKDGKASAQWPEIAKALLERAGKTMTVMR